MKFKKGYFKPFDCRGPFLVWQKGEIHATYHELIKIFGNPNRGPGPNRDNDHITIEWIVEFEDGTVSSICDWKVAELQSPIGMYAWKIGGLTGTSFTYIKQAIEEFRSKTVDKQ